MVVTTTKFYTISLNDSRFYSIETFRSDIKKNSSISLLAQWLIRTSFNWGSIIIEINPSMYTQQAVHYKNCMDMLLGKTLKRFDIFIIVGVDSDFNLFIHFR